MKPTTYTIGETAYKVRYAKAGTRICDRCALNGSLYCGQPLPCEKFEKKNKGGHVTHFGYFVRRQSPRRRSELLAALVALALVALLGLLCSCERKAQEPPARDESITRERLLGDFQDNIFVHKMTIEGHDYLLFGGRAATTPFVLHSESCPCKSTTTGK